MTIAHSKTKNLPEAIRQADILIAAVGKPEMVRGSWLKPGCVIVDVGINAVDDPTSKKGYRLVGDVCFEEAVKVASLITPVPGGVGEFSANHYYFEKQIKTNLQNNTRSNDNCNVDEKHAQFGPSCRNTSSTQTTSGS